MTNINDIMKMINLIHYFGNSENRENRGLEIEIDPEYMPNLSGTTFSVKLGRPSMKNSIGLKNGV